LVFSHTFHKPNEDKRNDGAHVSAFHWHPSMNSSTKAFQPQKINSVSERPQPLTQREIDHSNLLKHLRKLVEADPKEARAAMEMSQEHLPEIYLIAQDQPERYWADALMNSDSMQILLSLSPHQAKELLQEQDLRSLLEKIP
jgi:hypothetical protein